jgi:predicted AAA+ superfamily ATPase
MIKRQLETILRDSLLPSGKSILLLGPRQVGKSTLLNQLKPNLTINLGDEATFRDHVKDPSLIRRQTKALVGKTSIVLDEVQRLPSILNTVQTLIDEDKSLQFLITGSSARKLRKGKANLLPGRVFSRRLYPLSWWELRGDFDLDRALTLGTLPEVYLNSYGAELLANYINIYLREEILAEALTRNVESFARFIDVAAESNWREINYSQISSDSEIPKETLRRFYSILEDTLLVLPIKGFSKVKNRKAIQREKFLFFDNGVANAILNKHENQFTSTEKGSLFEQWFILQIIAYANYHRKTWEFFYYRDDKKSEVDLIVKTRKCVYAIEIKYSERVRKGFFDGLTTFAQNYSGKTKSFLIFRGKTPEAADQIQAIPYQTFLAEIDQYLTD